MRMARIATQGSERAAFRASIAAPIRPAGACDDPRIVRRAEDSAAGKPQVDLDRWMEAVERFDTLMSGADEHEIVRAFGQLACEIGDAVAASVRIVGGGGSEYEAHVGLTELQVNLLAAVHPAASAERETERRISDVHARGDFAGTLALPLFDELGVRAVQLLALHGADGTRFGTLVLYLRTRGGLDPYSERAIRLTGTRAHLALAHRRLADRARADASYLGAVLQGAHDGIVAIDLDGVMRSVNAAAARLFGRTASEMLGHRISSMLVPSQARASALHGGRACLTASDALGGAQEVLVVRPTGERIPVELTVNAIEQGFGFTAILRDISGRKLAEARLCDQDRLAVIGTLAAGLGHDLNNVLFPIRAHLNAIATPGGRLSAAKRTQHVTAIRSSVGYLQQLADSLHALALDPDGDGDGILHTEIDGWWRQSGALLGKTLHRRAQLDVAIEEGLPPAAVPPHALTRAVLNLLVNAADAMPAERQRELSRVSLRARMSRNGQEVLLEVADNGCGMTEEVRRRATDMFFTTKIRGLGTGLGLPLVRRVVERAGGAIEIDSVVGSGTTVRLRVPVAAEDGVVETVAAMRIADGRVRDLVRGYLEAFGARIDGALGLDDADVLVIDAAAVTEGIARRWTAVHPAERLVVLGLLPPVEHQALAEMGVTHIKDPTDIGEIERGLGAAMGVNLQENGND
jgi:PAS domain S-box-containing protein